MQQKIWRTVDDEQRALYAPGIPEGQGEFMLARIRSELSQELTGWHDACGHSGDGAQNVWPVLCDQLFSDLTADQPADLLRRSGGVEEIEPLCGRSRMQGTKR